MPLTPPAIPIASSDGRRHLVVVGASARGFAESASRLGWCVHAADLFADRDCRAAATSVIRLGGARDYPRDIPAAIEAFPAAPCVYTGALENHPEILAAIETARPLAGIAPGAVRRVRDPAVLAAVLRDAGIAFPHTVTSPADVPRDGTYLEKPLASAGGRGIRPWFGPSGQIEASRVWQRRVAGHSWSAAFVAHAGSSTMVAASRQFLGRPWCGTDGFAYCGSLDVPIDRLSPSIATGFAAAGRAVANGLGLVGVFGVDAVIDAGGTVHVVEVNPRPTASMELIERRCGWSMAAAHLAAFGHGSPPMCGPSHDAWWAKAIVFVPRDRPIVPVMPEELEACAARWSNHDGMPAIADIPADDEPLRAGSPLVTVFARGRSAAATVRALGHRARAIRGMLIASPAGSPLA